LAAGAGDAQRGVEAEQHANGVEGVDAVVAQFAGAVVPVPVPVVVEAIRVERPLRRRPQPQVVIDAGWHGTVLLVADARTVAGNPGADERPLAELARADELGGALVRR